MAPDRRLLAVFVCLGSLGFAGPALAAPTLDRPALSPYNADPRESSVSGLSSGGYMAVQLSVAYSRSFRGAGVIAGGPYHCAQGSVSAALGTCMNGFPAPSAASSIKITEERATAGRIDPIDSLRAQRVWLFSGLLDTTVKPVVMNALRDYYAHYLPATNLEYVADVSAAHTLPTASYGNLCQVSADPYLSNCGYDAAGKLLAHIYGSLEDGVAGAPKGELLSFDQNEFLPSIGKTSMAESGFLFVPAACARGELCRVHIALHGCKQAQELVQDQFAAHAGYNEWADHNRLLVLYPQAVSSAASPQNPNGCWDWWGYNDPTQYDTQDGVQMRAIKGMLDRLTQGFDSTIADGGTPLPPVLDGSVNEAPAEAGASADRDAGGPQTRAPADAALDNSRRSVQQGCSLSVAAQGAKSGGAKSGAPSALLMWLLAGGLLRCKRRTKQRSEQRTARRR